MIHCILFGHDIRVEYATDVNKYKENEFPDFMFVTGHCRKCFQGFVRKTEVIETKVEEQ